MKSFFEKMKKAICIIVDDTRTVVKNILELYSYLIDYERGNKREKLKKSHSAKK